MKTITKRSDALIRHIRQVRDGKNRDQILCEGEKLVEELAQSKLQVKHLLYTHKYETKAKKWIRQMSIPGHCLSDDVMRFSSDLKTPPGIMALADRPTEASAFKPKKGETLLILVLHNMQLPQNVGALIRTSEAAGVSEVWVTGQTADPYAPKSLRGSAGSAFRMGIRHYETLQDAVKLLKAHHIKVCAASAKGQQSYTHYEWTQATALVMGSEAHGFGPHDEKQFEALVHIPMKGHIESLNVGVAAAVCLFEAARQRQTVK